MDIPTTNKKNDTDKQHETQITTITNINLQESNSKDCLNNTNDNINTLDTSKPIQNTPTVSTCSFAIHTDKNTE